MKKRFLTSLFTLTVCAAGLYAQGVSYITVTNEESYKTASDFSNTYEVNINQHGLKTISKCQAVRLDKNWFITAAHCVEPMCDKACSIQVRLVVKSNYEMDITTTHKPDNPKVFKNPKSNVAKKNAAYDLALLFFPSYDSKFVYKDPSARTYIPEKLFLRRIPDYNVYYKAENGTNIPVVLAVDSKVNVMLKRQLSVASIWDGKTSVLETKKPVFYSPKLHYILTENFGIIKGISGSGVMTNTGELVGIVSAIGDLVKTNSVTNKAIVTPVAFFAAFDPYSLEFIRKYVGGFEYKTADKNYLTIVPDQYKTITDSIDNLGM